jgi:hypothetical protein
LIPPPFSCFANLFIEKKKEKKKKKLCISS